MPDARRDRDYLEDIYEAIQKVQEYTKEQSWEQFCADDKTQDAVIRNLEVLGEAAKRISPQFRKRFSQIPWTEMAGTRDRLIHHYFGINRETVWQIIQHELPALLNLIKSLIDTFPDY